MKKLMYIAAALLVLVGCNNKEEINGTQNPPAQIVTITGGIDFSSQVGARKVAAKDGWEDVAAGQNVEFVWEVGDEIAVISLDMSEIKKFTVSKIFEGGKAAEFIGEALSSMDQYAVLYPYELDIDPSKSKTWYLNQKYDGKLRPAVMGMGRENSFMLNMFHTICDLPLIGDIKLGKIEVWVIEQDKEDVEELVKMAAVFMPEGGLQLSSTPQHVTFSLSASSEHLTFRFYDTENNMIMEKEGNYIKPSGKGQTDPIVSFPELTVTPATPAPDPKDVFNEGATMCFSLNLNAEALTKTYDFTYKYSEGEFNVVKILEDGNDVTAQRKKRCPVEKYGDYSFGFQMGDEGMIYNAENRTYNFIGENPNYLELTDFKIDDVSIFAQLTDITEK